MPVGSTSQRSVQDLGFTEICLLTPLCCLYPLPVRQASVLLSASFRSHLALDSLAVQLTLPLAGCVEGFHLQVNAPCRAHMKKSPAFPGRALAVQAVIHSAAWEEGHPPGHPVLACACGRTFFRDSLIGAASIGRA